MLTALLEVLPALADTRPVTYAAAGDSAPEGDDAEPVDLDWERASNLNRCQEPTDIDAAFDRGEVHVGAALIALVYNNPDTDAVLPRVARGLRWPESGDPPAEPARVDAHRPAPRPGG